LLPVTNDFIGRHPSGAAIVKNLKSRPIWRIRAFVSCPDYQIDISGINIAGLLFFCIFCEEEDMKKSLFAVALALVGTPALAQDAKTFNGFFAGVQTGWQQDQAKVASDSIDQDVSTDAFMYGAQVGYDWRFGDGVLGAEAMLAGSTGSSEVVDLDFNSYELKAGTTWGFSARLGYVVTEPVLLYARLGYSWGGYESLIVPFDPRETRSATTWPSTATCLRLHCGHLFHQWQHPTCRHSCRPQRAHLRQVHRPQRRKLGQASRRAGDSPPNRRAGRADDLGRSQACLGARLRG